MPNRRWQAGSLLEHLAGPHAITSWTWVLTWPFGFMLTFLLRYPDAPATVWWGFVAAGAQLVTVPTMWLVARALRRWPGVLSALLGFALIGATRAPLVDAWCRAFGFPSTTRALWSPAQAGIAVAACSAIAVMVGEYRANQAVAARLREAEADLDWATQAQRQESDRLWAVVLTRVLAPIESAMSALLSDPTLSPQTAAAALRRLAEHDVREVSHDIAVAPRTRVVRPAPRPIPSRSRRIAVVLMTMRALAPLPTTIAYLAIMVVPEVALSGLRTAAVETPVLAVTLSIGAWLVRRLGVPGRSGPTAPIRLFLGYLVVAVGSSWLVSLACAITGTAQPFWWIIVIVYPLMTMVFAAITSSVERQASLEAALARSVAELAQASIVAAADEYRLRRHFARVLHGDVQGELLTMAASLLQRAPGIDVADVAELVMEVAPRVRRLLEQAPEHDAHSLGQALSQYTANWGAALDIELHLDAAADAWCADRPQHIDRLLDVCSEALVNVIRHGDGRAVTIDIRLASGGLLLQVTSVGRLPAVGVPGLGSEEMERLCDRWQLQQRGGHVVLTAHFA